MDLLTVVTHELGHVLGFEHDTTGGLEAALAPGTRLVPEALTSTGTGVVLATPPDGSAMSIGATTSGATAIARGGELGGTQPRVSLATLGNIDAVFVTGMGSRTTLPAAAGTHSEGISSSRILVGVLLPQGQQTPAVLTTAATVPAAPAARLDQGSSNYLVPGLQPPVPRGEIGGGGAVGGVEEPEEVPVYRRAPEPDSSALAVDRATEDQVDTLVRQRERDACFADGSWMANVEAFSSRVPAPAAALVALGVLGGHWAGPRAKTERRTQGRFLN
jgi:hypothetical protein